MGVGRYCYLLQPSHMESSFFKIPSISPTDQANISEHSSCVKAILLNKWILIWSMQLCYTMTTFGSLWLPINITILWMNSMQCIGNGHLVELDPTHFNPIKQWNDYLGRLVELLIARFQHLFSTIEQFALGATPRIQGSLSRQEQVLNLLCLRDSVSDKLM